MKKPLNPGKLAAGGFTRVIPPGIFTAQEAIDAGLPRVSFYRLVNQDCIIRLARGIYQNPKVDIDPAIIDLAIACKYFGANASIGGLTALFRYGLVEQVPTKIWVMVPANVKRVGQRYRVVRTQIDQQIGVVNHRYYRIANVRRACVEALRYSTKVGLKTAIKAAREAIRSGQTSESALLRCAMELGLEAFVLRHWDAILVD